MIAFELFTIDGGQHGPYAASPVSNTWGGYDLISVTRATAELIVDDLNAGDAGCGLTAAWDGPNLVFTEDERYRGEQGSKTISPDGNGRYQIGGLWPWARVEDLSVFTADAVRRATLAA